MEPEYIWGRWSPARVLVAVFGTAITAGTLLLHAQWASAGPRLSWVDALFTATSAVCVTGLVVVDTGTDLSIWGQLVTLVLLQVGGIGIMTLSTTALVMLGRRVQATGRVIMFRRLDPEGRGDIDVAALLRRVVVMTLSFEAVGAVLLALRWPADTWTGALWGGLYHSVSAFCNAGFGLFSDSLVRLQGDWVVNLTVMALIVAGGLGFPVLLELGGFLRRGGQRRRIVTLHTKLVLLVSTALIVVGCASLYLLERDHLLADLGVGESWLAALFQSITPRTAGFNTLPIDSLQPTSLFLLILLMIIGGSPASTAGGIKTTVLGTLAAFVWSRSRGRDTVDVFRRTVPEADVRRAVSVAASALLALFIGVLALLITEAHWGVAAAAPGAQPAYPPGITQHGFFLEIFFEAVSALGTVGLSTGVTPLLSVAGKLVVVVLMFAGRLGPLTLAVAVGRSRRRGSYRYPEARIMVG